MTLFRPLLSLAALLPTLALAQPHWRFEGARGEVEIDTARTGQLTRWVVDGKALVAGEPASPLLLEHADGAVARFEATSHRAEPGSIVVEGVLRGSDRPDLPARLRYTVEEAGAKLGVQVETEPAKANAEPLAAFTWKLPLALQPRKKVAFRGEHDMEWETRYFYQFMIDSPGHLLPRPDRNEWRYFGLDQLGPRAFRLWKSESTTTAPLVMQQGEAAAPWVQLFDRKGGVTLEAPALAAQAPMSLRVDAAGPGALEVALHSRAFAPTPAQRVLGRPHTFTLHATSSEAATLALRARLGGPAKPAAAVPPEAVLEEPAWLRTTPLPGGVQMVSGGTPFAAGAVRDAAALRVEVAGKAVPSQSRALARWPDGSVKWALLTFPADPALATATCEPPRVSLRDGRFLPVRIRPGEPLLPKAGLEAREEEGGTISLRNGPLALTLGPGETWLRSLTFNGKEQLRTDAGPQVWAIYRQGPEAVLPFEREPRGGKEERCAWKAERVTLEEAGPLRAVIRLEGVTTGAEPTRIILRVECMAGRPELRVTQSTEFLFKDPRRTFLTRLGVDLALASPGEGRFSGFPEAPRGPGELVQLTPVHSELRQPGQPPRFGGRLPGWVEAEANDARVVAAIRDFWQQAPNAVALEEGRLRLDFWPEAAGPMDVRRYSNYPHRGQGESVGPEDDWVETKFYPQDPFVGISRSAEWLLSFAPEAEAEARVADFQSPPLLYAGLPEYAATRVILPTASAEAWPRAWEAWTRFTQFWLWHRERNLWYGKWDFGDFRHLFRGGYGWIAKPETLAALVRNPPSKKPGAPRPARTVRQLDYQPPNDWAYDNGRWGWSNTEGLPGLFLQHEYLRHGNRVVYFAAEAMARRSRDVVTRHAGRWLGGGTRHGVQPWSCGNHEERQTTITEYRLHYFLSGEPRSREVIEKLYREVYSKKPVDVDAAHSGRLGGLFFHWELSGSPTEAETLRRYTHAFLSPEGLYVEPVLRFPGPEAEAPARMLNSGSMFFHAFGGLHALLEYQQTTGDEAIRNALVQFANAALADQALVARYQSGKVSGGEIFWPAIAFAAQHAQDPEPYRAFLQTYLSQGGAPLLYQPTTHNPAHWSGPSGHLAGSVPMTFFWMNWAPYTTAALPKDTVWNPALAATLEAREATGSDKRPRPVSWQDEFDTHPELNDYLGKQQPWN